MDTKIINVDGSSFDDDELQEAATLLREGEVVAFPTETVYGLGCNGLDEDAIGKVFEAKGRPQDNPLILHIASNDELYDLAERVPALAEELMEKFWPGPMTLILKKQSHIPDKVTGGLDSVGIRMPSHPIANRLIALSGCPIAAPSANRSTKPSPTRADHVVEDLAGRIPMIIDGGETGVGVESTVIDMTVYPPVVLRPGAVTLEMLREVDSEFQLDTGLEPGKTPKSPGQKYRHYAPKTKVVLVEDDADILRELEGRIPMFVAIMGMSDFVQPWDKLMRFDLGDSIEQVSANMFNALRILDHYGLQVILAQTYREEGLGLAVMNRLKKAASQSTNEK